jgi:hypothetical protein
VHHAQNALEAFDKGIRFGFITLDAGLDTIEQAIKRLAGCSGAQYWRMDQSDAHSIRNRLVEHRGQDAAMAECTGCGIPERHGEDPALP